MKNFKISQNGHDLYLIEAASIDQAEHEVIYRMTHGRLPRLSGFDYNIAEATPEEVQQYHDDQVTSSLREAGLLPGSDNDQEPDIQEDPARAPVPDPATGELENSFRELGFSDEMAGIAAASDPREKLRESKTIEDQKLEKLL